VIVRIYCDSQIISHFFIRSIPVVVVTGLHKLCPLFAFDQVRGVGICVCALLFGFPFLLLRL
jgi:hypothetical protein